MSDIIDLGDGIQVRKRKLSDFAQNPDNPVEHNPRNLGVLLESVQQHGALRSGIAKDGKILGGNLTWEAMAEAGIEEVIEVTTDGQTWVMVNRPDLTEDQARSAAYYDQRAGELASYDVEQVLDDLHGGLDLSGLFFENELDELIASLPDQGLDDSFLDDLADQEIDKPEGFEHPYINLNFPATREERDYVYRILAQVKDSYLVPTVTAALIELCKIFEESNANS